MLKRNFVLGLVFLAVFLLGLVLRGSSETLPAQTTIGGRYQIIINPNMRRDTFLLDTQTGRVWEPVVYQNLQDEPRVWEPITRIDNAQDYRTWVVTQKPKSIPLPPGATIER